MEKKIPCETGDTCNRSFIDIPDEIILLIFSFFNIRELCINVAPVCRRWYTLANYPGLWLKLNLSFDAHSNQTMLRLIEKSPYLFSLEISMSENKGDLKSVVEKCCRLKELNIQFSEGLTKDIFEVIVANLCKLEVLIVKGNIYGSDCYPLLGKLKYLKHLDMSESNSDILDNDGLIAIAEQCENLQYLNIYNMDFINDVSVIRLIELRGSSLIHLYLSGDRMTDEGFHALSGCMRLQHLGIYDCTYMTDYGFLGLKGLSNLTWLKLSVYLEGLTAQGMIKLFTEGTFSRLAYLKLGDCNELNDRVLISLSKKCPSIESVILSISNQLTDAGVTKLVQTCHHIRELSLNSIAQLTGTAFRKLHFYLPNITILDLEGCYNIDDIIIRQLVCDKPHLAIFGYNGAELSLHELQQHYVKVKENEKTRALFNLLNILPFAQAAIFVKSVQHCMALGQVLKEQKFTDIGIHCAIWQDKRPLVHQQSSRYQQFQKFQKNILITIDLVGCGVYGEDINIVVNYDMPDSSDTYFHRFTQAVSPSPIDNKEKMGITFVTEESEVKILNKVQEKFEVNITELSFGNVYSFVSSHVRKICFRT